VFHDLKRIKILPECIEEGEVRYFDKDNKELFKTQDFSSSFDLTADSSHLFKIRVPERKIDIEETSIKADDYIKTSK
jgi:hypothetical protein